VGHANSLVGCAVAPFGALQCRWELFAIATLFHQSTRSGDGAGACRLHV